MNESMDRALADWLLEGPEHGPREGLDRALAATRRVPQRPGWTLLERWIPMDMTVARTPSSRPLLIGLATLLLLTAVAGAILLVGAPRRALPAPFGPAGNGSVVFARDGDLWVAEDLGGDARPLTTGEGDDHSPMFSRQGDVIAFLRAEAGSMTTPRIMTMRADGSGLREVAGPFREESLVGWAPDGSGLLIAYEWDLRPRLAIVDMATGAIHELELGMPADQAAWRPDGSMIAFRSHGDTGNDVFLVRPDGTDVRALGLATIGDQDDFWSLGWSPDGARLAVTRRADLGGFLGWQTSIVEITPDGTVQETHDIRLDPESAGELLPSWSPDGANLAFIVDKHGTRQVAIAPADGSAPALGVGPVVASGSAGFAYDWSPDGRTLLLTVLPQGAAETNWSIDVASGEATEQTDWTYLPSWQRVAP